MISASKNKLTLFVLFRALILITVVPLLPILTARDFAWTEAWIYAFIQIAGFIVSRWFVYKKNPDLLRERAGFTDHENTQSWDKRLIGIMALGNIVMLIVPGLDRIRGGSFHPGIAFKSAALILMIAGYAFSAYALVVNRFFSGVVRIQKERGHKVITEGPYALVRHPGYAGGLLTFLLTPVLLESLWMFLPVIFVSVILIIRTAKEDAFLQRELDGYKEYAGKVKYELIWGVW